VSLGDISTVKMAYHPPENNEVEQSLNTRMDKVTRVNRLRVNYKAPTDVDAQLTYVTRNLGWAPSYRLDTDHKQKVAKLSMKSVIINDAEVTPNNLLIDNIRILMLTKLSALLAFQLLNSATCWIR
jgi:hypothetical protein